MVDISQKREPKHGKKMTECCLCIYSQPLSLYSALSKALKPCEDKKDSSKADKIIANEHPNDIIHVTQYDIDSSFPKRLMLGKLRYGSLSNRKMKSKGKIDMYVRINFKKGVNDGSNTK